jgi:hypothetical protein
MRHGAFLIAALLAVPLAGRGEDRQVDPVKCKAAVKSCLARLDACKTAEPLGRCVGEAQVCVDDTTLCPERMIDSWYGCLLAADTAERVGACVCAMPGEYRAGAGSCAKKGTQLAKLH